MPSVALAQWQNDRTIRLNDVDAHCAAVIATVPPNPPFIDETLRGFVLHLSVQFQGFCRDLYTECSQICIAQLPAALQATVAAQFFAHLALENGNPNHSNITKDFDRFGFALNLHTANPRQVTDLGHLNKWRNKAAHQGTKPLAGGVPAVLTLPLVRNWRTSCDGLAVGLDGIMHQTLLRILGVAPW